MRLHEKLLKLVVMKKNLAEFVGTFWLVLCGCGAAILAVKFPAMGGVGVALSFGVTMLVMSSALGHISGAHLNPAVTLGLWAGGRIPGKAILPYAVSQTLGAIAAATLLYFFVTGNGDAIGNFAANGYGEHSPGKYNLLTALATEFLMTFMFLLVILGATDERAKKPIAGMVIGLTLTLIHLVSIPVTNTSVNPARSISQALFVGDWAIAQLWLFILAPIAGAVAAGYFYKFLSKEVPTPAPVAEGKLTVVPKGLETRKKT